MNKAYDILVVEDESVVLSAVKKILEPERLLIDTAVDAGSALEKLSRNTFRLIVSDLMLPKISGYDFVKVVKEKYPCIPIIVITGYATLENALQSFKMGSFDFIPKPFDTEAFLGVVWRGLRYSQKKHRMGFESHSCLPSLGSSIGDESHCDLYCLGHHAWVKIERDGSAIIGVGDAFPNMIDNIFRIEFYSPGNEIIQGKCSAQILSKDGLINMFWAPLSGIVTAHNRELEENAQLLNRIPFREGWFFRVVPNNLEEEIKHLTCCSKKPG